MFDINGLMNEIEADLDKITRIIDEGDHEKIKIIIQVMQEKDERTCVLFKIFILEHFLRQDKIDEFEYWVDYTEFNIDYEDGNDFDRNILMKIIDYGHVSVNTIMHVLNRTKNIHVKDRDGETAIYKLVNKLEEPDIDVIAYRNILVELLKRGAHPNTFGGPCVLEYVSGLNMNDEFELILKHSKYYILGPAYISAINNNNYDFVEILLRYIEDMNAPIHNGMTPLQIAQNAKNPNNEIIELIRVSDPNPEADLV